MLKITGSSPKLSTPSSLLERNVVSLGIADTTFEKVIIASLTAIDGISHLSFFRWLPYLAGCGGEDVAKIYDPENNESLDGGINNVEADAGLDTPPTISTEICDEKDQFLFLRDHEHAELWRPKWAPRGDKIAFQKGVPPFDVLDLYTVNHDGSGMNHIFNGGVQCFAWLADGSDIVVLERQNNDSQAMFFSEGEDRKIYDGGGCPFENSPRDDIRFFEGCPNLGGFKLTSLNANTGESRTLSSFCAGEENPFSQLGFHLGPSLWSGWSVFAPSPNRQKFSVIEFDEFGRGGANLYVVNANGTSISKLAETPDAQRKIGPLIWFPDNRRLLFNNLIDKDECYKEVWWVDTLGGEFGKMLDEHGDRICQSVPGISLDDNVVLINNHSVMTLFSFETRKEMKAVFRFTPILQGVTDEYVGFSPNGRWVTLGGKLWGTYNGTSYEADLTSVALPSTSTSCAHPIWVAEE